MPLNNVANRNHSLEVDGVLTLLESTMAAVSSARTVEDRLLLEARVIELFQKIIGGKLVIPEVSTRLNCNKENFAEEKSSLKYKTDLNMSKLEKLAQAYLDGYNTKVKELMEITGSLKRVRQKKAALDLWDREKAKWVLAEKFFNFDLLSTSDAGAQVLDVDTTEGIATLPVISVEQVKPNSIYLSNGNGSPGNSDAAVTVNNINPAFMFDEKPETHFEYERLDSGPMRVTVGCDFSQTEILNRIQIKPAAIPNSLSFEVENIIFYLPGNKSISIKEHVSPTVTYENFTVKSVGNDIFWQMTFAPVACNSVKIVFKQESSYLLGIPTSDGRVASRKRFSIGVKHIEFQQVRFSSEGGISSQALEIPAGLYAAESTSEVFPKNKNLLRASLDFSGNGGEDWDLDVFGFEDSETPNTIRLDGVPENVFWRLYVQRQDDAFEDISSFTDTEPAVNVGVVSQLMSLNQSPNKISLPEKPYNNNIGVYQPRVCRRTDDPREAVRLSRVPRIGNPGEGFTINLPIELDEVGYTLDPEDMEVYVGNKKALAQEDATGSAVSFSDIQVGTGTTDTIWAINKNWTRIALQHRRQLSEVKWKFPSQKLLLEERSGGYYARFTDRFDPDKDRIRVSHLPSATATSSVNVPFILSVVNLQHKNVLEESVHIQSESSILFTKTSNLTDVKNDNTTDPSEILYHVDGANGRVYFSKTISEVVSSDVGPVKLVYEHGTTKVLRDSQYEVWGEDGEVQGIIIAANAVVTKDREYYPLTSSASVFKNIDIQTGDVVSKAKLFDSAGINKALDLPDNYIVMNSLTVSPSMFEEQADIYPREVPYIDGKIEFLGLKEMNSEETVEIVSDGSGIVNFKLAAGAAYYAPLGVLFEDSDVFKKLDPSLTGVGDYSVSTDGEVSLRVADSGNSGTLSGGIKYSYSYQDPAFISRGLYSVDYRNGILYSAEEMRSAADIWVKYKVANYKAEYDIVKKIDSWSYRASTNSILVRSEKISSYPITKRVKAYYFTRDEYTPLKDLREFFSPIFYNISFRFQ